MSESTKKTLAWIIIMSIISIVGYGVVSFLVELFTNMGPITTLARTIVYCLGICLEIVLVLAVPVSIFALIYKAVGWSYNTLWGYHPPKKTD